MDLNQAEYIAKQTFVDQSANGLEETATPDHLAPIYGKEWAAWKWICVRGAGFPSHLVERLSSPLTLAAAQELISARLTVQASIKESIAVVRQALSSIEEQGVAKRLHRSLKALNQGRLPTSVSELPAAVAEKLLAAQSGENEALTKFKAEFQSEVARISSAIRETANDDSFQRAILLQNARAMRHMRSAFRPAAGAEQKRGFKERQNEELIASYIQRYSAKNDTIGFFGPVGWARFVSEGDAITARPGPGLIKKSSMYFEHWCIDALANKISEDERLRPWIAPRRSPYFYLDKTNLYYPDGVHRAVIPSHAAVLERCDGERTARQIALELLGLPNSYFHNEIEVYSALQHMAERHIIFWKLELPVEAGAEKRLRRALHRIEAADLRLPVLAALDELENARQHVAAANTHSEALDASLQALEETFIRLTGRETSRAAGEMYAGRTLIYNDCQRDLQIEIGPALVSELGPPLSLILTSARWFTHRTAQLYREAFLKAYQDIVAKSKLSQVNFMQFWLAVQELIVDPKIALFKQVLVEFQDSWHKILNLPQGESRVYYQSSDLRAKVSSIFNAARPGWSGATYHSPDVMIAAPDVDSIRAGDYILVLGELHLAVHTLRGAFAVSQHPSPRDMYAAMEYDVPAPHIFPVPRKSWPGLTTRTAITLVPDNHFSVEVSPDSVSPMERSRTLPISAFVVEISGGEVVVRSRDRSISLTAVEFLSELLSLQLADRLRILPRLPHTPRVMIDRLVITRESWRIPASDISFIHEKEESARFYQAHEWRKSLDLPRLVFARVPVEPKPVYVDFASPVYVELLCKMIRRVLASDHPEKQVELSEMLPAPEQNWLRDASGQKYTSELRIIVSDQIPTEAKPANVPGRRVGSSSALPCD
jgi:hypothetical protein